MFSGKSTEVLRLLERYCLAGKKVSYYIPDIDSRTSKTITISSTRKVYKIPVNKLPTNLTYYEIKDSEVIAFDEVQFFNSKIVSLCQELKDIGKTVIASGLDMDYLRRPFGYMGNLMAIADEVYKLTAICECGAEAQYTQRLEGGNKTIVIGDNYYTPRCGNCYEEYIYHLKVESRYTVTDKDRYVGF